MTNNEWYEEKMNQLEKSPLKDIFYGVMSDAIEKEINMQYIADTFPQYLEWLEKERTLKDY